MSNVFELHNKEQRELEVSAWIAKLDRELTSTEKDDIRRWIAADPRNKEMLSNMAGLWDDMDSLSRLSELFPNPLLEQQQNKGRWVFAAASGFAVVAVLLVSVFMTMNTGTGVNIPVESIAYQTAIGGLSRVELSDGSQITLNTNSRIDVEFSKQQRKIHLQHGELHIEVAHDSSRPFNVIAGDRIFQAVGTAFSISIDDKQRIELLVTDGKVKVGIMSAMMADAGDQNTDKSTNVLNDALSVSKGQRFLLDDSNELLDKLDPEDVDAQLSWRDGNLIFHGESLGNAAAEISRYAPVEFVFLEEDLQQIRVAGLFKVGDVTGFLASLEANFDIVYQRLDEETIQLSSSAGEAN